MCHYKFPRSDTGNFIYSATYALFVLIFLQPEKNLFCSAAPAEWSRLYLAKVSKCNIDNRVDEYYILAWVNWHQALRNFQGNIDQNLSERGQKLPCLQW